VQRGHPCRRTALSGTGADRIIRKGVFIESEVTFPVRAIKRFEWIVSDQRDQTRLIWKCKQVEGKTIDSNRFDPCLQLQAA